MSIKKLHHLIKEIPQHHRELSKVSREREGERERVREGERESDEREREREPRIF